MSHAARDGCTRLDSVFGLESIQFSANDGYSLRRDIVGWRASTIVNVGDLYLPRELNTMEQGVPPIACFLNDHNSIAQARACCNWAADAFLLS